TATAFDCSNPGLLLERAHCAAPPEVAYAATNRSWPPPFGTVTLPNASEELSKLPVIYNAAPSPCKPEGDELGPARIRCAHCSVPELLKRATNMLLETELLSVTDPTWMLALAKLPATKKSPAGLPCMADASSSPLPPNRDANSAEPPLLY